MEIGGLEAKLNRVKSFLEAQGKRKPALKSEGELNRFVDGRSIAKMIYAESAVKVGLNASGESATAAFKAANFSARERELWKAHEAWVKEWSTYPNGIK